MEGAQTFVNALGECACVMPGACESQCGGSTDFCSGGNASTACGTCLDNSLGTSGACNMPVVTACETDPDCVSYLNCGDSCPP
jgi:hypothetical protein